MSNQPEYSITGVLPLPVAGWHLIIDQADTKRWPPDEIMPVAADMAEFAAKVKTLNRPQWSKPVKVHRKGSGRLPAWLVAIKMASNNPMPLTGLIWLGTKQELKAFCRSRWQEYGQVKEFVYQPGWQGLN